MVQLMVDDLKCCLIIISGQKFDYGDFNFVEAGVRPHVAVLVHLVLQLQVQNVSQVEVESSRPVHSVP